MFAKCGLFFSTRLWVFFIHVAGKRGDVNFKTKKATKNRLGGCYNWIPLFSSRLFGRQSQCLI